MKLAMRLSGVLVLLLITASAFAFFLLVKPKFSAKAALNKNANTNKTVTLKLNSAIGGKLMSIKSFIKTKGFNTTYCFFIDMKAPSGKNRFYIYNLKTDSVEDVGLVAHGSSTNYNSGSILFSNEPNSLCTSLGKYKIGKSYMGKYGLAYKLHGLDSTNNNAYCRSVVLHGHECVPDAEVYPMTICQSWGCPTVAPSFLNKLQHYIDKSPKPILLDIYY